MLMCIMPNNNDRRTAFQMGYRLLTTSFSNNSVFIGGALFNSVQLRVRPSHQAYPPDEGETMTPGGEWTKWGGRHVPLSFRRGIPFRGDRFGSCFYASSALSPIGD